MPRKTDYIERVHNVFYFGCTRAEALDKIDGRYSHDLVPISRCTLQELELHTLASEIVDNPCNLCGRPVRGRAQDAINAHCGC